MAIYENDVNLGNTITTFTILALLIAAVGLLGLVAFTTSQRSRKIGIRKVLGASSQTILMMLLKNYIFLQLIALLIAIPLGYYFAESWLQDFAYRVALTPAIFVQCCRSSYHATYNSNGWYTYPPGLWFKPGRGSEGSIG